jgi:hypothetical protein
MVQNVDIEEATASALSVEAEKEFHKASEQQQKRRPRSYRISKSISYTEQTKALIDYQMSLIEQEASVGQHHQKDEMEKAMKMKRGKGVEKEEGEVEEGELADSLDSDQSGDHRHRRKSKKREKEWKLSHSRCHSLRPHNRRPEKR